MLATSSGHGLFRTLGFGLLAAAALSTSPQPAAAGGTRPQVMASSARPQAAAAPVFSEVHTLAAPTTGVPKEFTFDVSVAGTYTVTLTDLGAALTPPAPLASVKLAATNGTSLVGTVLVGPGTLTLGSLTTGTYVLHVVGMPGSVPGSGPFGIQVNGPGGASFAFQDTLALPAQGLPSSEGVLDDSFTVAAGGTYTVSLTDLQLPQSLSTLTLLLIQQGGGTPLATLSNSTVLQQNVSLNTGVTYDIFALGQANSTANAGLYSALVTPTGGGAIAYGRAVPVGSTISVGSIALKAGSDTFTLTDLKYPAALSQVGAVLMLNGQAVAPPLTAAGSQSFTATVGTYQAYAVASPAASPGDGSYALSVTQGSTTLYSAARAATAAGGTLSAFSFDTNISSAGMETVTLADFQFPAALSGLSLGVAQSGALLGSISGPTTLNVNAASGPLSLIVFAQPNGSAGGLFGIDMAPSAGGSPVFETTQGVGALFTASQLSIVSAGSYSVTATDLGFPASFATYDTVVTQGATQVGSIFGGGTFSFTATAGNYTLNFIAQPTGSDQAGTYALSVAQAPAAPVVTLTVDHSTVSSGSTVNLIWSSQNATSCTASGGWSGTKALSGTTTSATLTGNTTFTLTCAGAGGSASKSVTVTVTTPSGGGGGGALDGVMLLVLAVLLGIGRPTWLREKDTTPALLP